MIKEFAKDALTCLAEDKFYQRHIKSTSNYFRGRLRGHILDVGDKSPLTISLQNKYNVNINNTVGDLDIDFDMPLSDYDTIIYSHTIEHQFNPLFTLLKLKDALKDSGRLYILLPERGKLLWCKGHYHEIDSYRFGQLMKRAGLKIVNKTYQKIWRNWYCYIGIRPLLRVFFEYHVIYEISK